MWCKVEDSREVNEGLEDKELKRRLLEFRVLTDGWMDPVICIQMALGWINRRPADRLTHQPLLLLLLLRFSRGVSPHRGSFVAGADPSGASPAAVQPAEAGPPAGSPHRGEARPPHQVNHTASSPPGSALLAISPTLTSGNDVRVGLWIF